MCHSIWQRWLPIATCWTALAWSTAILHGQVPSLSHGPMLGHVTAHSVRIWDGPRVPLGWPSALAAVPTGSITFQNQQKLIFTMT